ncbi:hypothetical protein [Treponema succinifaciens]|uniref:hypothetical protein n=1 Tax=Treponema succinifaciens TaxID=167 RepID=UPI003F7FFDC6
MKFIRKNILTAVFFSVFAILLGGALISCSNGSSSSDEDDDESSYGTKIYSESVTFSETPTQIVSAEMLADLSIKSLTIKVINVNYSGSDDWWFTACSDSSWSNKAKLEWQSGEGANSLYLATITDAAAIAAYKANGIYIAGTNNATASVSVFYVEGEAEESGDSSEEALIKSFTSNTGSSSFTISSTYQLLAKYEAVSSASKVTIKITNVSYTGTSSDSWWFVSGTDTNSYKQKLEWKEGDSYELEISAISEYSKGIYLGGLEGLTGTVTVSYE